MSRDPEPLVQPDDPAVLSDDELIESLRSGREVTSADDQVTQWMGQLRERGKR